MLNDIENCDVDNVTYGELKKIGFKRTKTLGYDGDCCDFHFYKKVKFVIIIDKLKPYRNVRFLL